MFSSVPWRQEQGKGKKTGLWCSLACFNQVMPYFLHFRVQINFKNFFKLEYTWAALVIQMVKNLPPMQETCVQSLHQEDPLEKEMATHSSNCLENPMDRGSWQATVHEVTKNWT